MTKKCKLWIIIASLIALVSNACAQQDKIELKDVHNLQSIKTIQQLKQNYNGSDSVEDYWNIEESIPEMDDESLLTADNCHSVIERVEHALVDHFLSLSLHKLAVSCYLILEQKSLANVHEQQLINIASVMTATGDGKTTDKALWANDIKSAYIFLDLAGFQLIDAQLSIENDKVFLFTYIRDKKTFGEYKAFDVTKYFDKIQKFIDDEEVEWESYLNVILASQLKDKQSIIALAIAGMTEAQILLADTLMENVKEFKGLYPSVLMLYKMAAEQGSAIAQHRYAQRVFLDQLEGRYAEAHSYLTDAIEQRYYRAFVLAIVIREKQLGIETDEATVEDLLTLASLESENPGALEYRIAESYANKKQWNDLELAHKYYLKSADKGYHWGAINVGHDLIKGRGVKKDTKKGFKWYEKATHFTEAEDAYLNLGYAYNKGIGVKKNQQKALENYTKAAELGSHIAATNIGVMYAYKKYKAVDYSKALTWFEKAAEYNDTKAFYNIAVLYFYGKGVKQDYKKAFEYFQKAQSSTELFEPYLYLGIMTEKGLGTEKNREKALEYYELSKSVDSNKFANLNIELIDFPNHEPLSPHESYLEELENKAKNNDPIALYQMGSFVKYSSKFNDITKVMKKSGKYGFAKAYWRLGANVSIFQRNDKKALKYYKKAFEMGNMDAATLLAKKYLVKNETDNALSALNTAVEKKHESATYMLAGLYEDGIYVKKDMDKAINFYLEGLENSHKYASIRMAELYIAGKLDHSYGQKIVSELERIVRLDNNRQAKYLIANIYLKPFFSDHSIEKAQYWLIDAAKNGDGDAILLLGKINLLEQYESINYNSAQFFFTNAVYKKEPEAAFWLGLIYEHGLDTEIDYESAKLMYSGAIGSNKNAQSLNNISVLTCQNKIKPVKGVKPYKTLQSLSTKSKTALFNLAWSNEHGTCRRKNKKNAQKYYHQAAEKGSAHALYRMYQLHDQGILFEKDPQKAQQYLKKAKAAAAKILQPAMMTTFMDLPLEELLEHNQSNDTQDNKNEASP